MSRNKLFVAILAGSAAMAAGAAAFAAEPAQSTRHAVYTYAIALDRDGGVAEVKPHGGPTDATGAEVQRQIADWVFESAEAGGAPAASETFLRVVMDKAADAPRVLSATTGPAPDRLTQPEFAVSDQRAGRQGAVVLKLQVAADGSVAAAEVHDVSGQVSRGMASAAVDAAKQWRFVPETVGGAPVASTILWPVCYLGRSSDASVCAWQGPDAQRFSSKAVLTLNPAVKLVSPLAFERR